MPGAPACTALPRLASLEEVFPGTGLADAFHSSAVFRAALRAATRRDLFRDPGRGPAAAAQMTAMGSTCVLDWRPATQQGAVCAAMDAALAAAGVRLRGAALLSGLAALCSVPESDDKAAGSLTDIAHTGRKQVNHSWHQDSGLRVTTVLLVRVLAAVRCVCTPSLTAALHRGSPRTTTSRARGASRTWLRCRTRCGARRARRTAP